MSMRWVLVAGRAGARIFSWDTRAGQLRLSSDIDNPAGRLKRGELETDRPGMAFRGEGGPPMASKHPAHEQMAERFAHVLAEVLKIARNDHRFNSLVLVAEPHFLGLLRGALDDVTASMVEHSIAKDLAGLSIAETGTHLEEAMQALSPR